LSPELRVLHVAAGNLYGGVESLLVTLARHREADPAVEQHFACCYEGRLSDELRAAGASVHRLGVVRISRPWGVWQARRRLRKLVRQERFDAAICHSAWPQAVFGPAVVAEGVPLVFWLHGATDGRHWLERRARRTTPDLAVCNSQFTAGQLPALYPRVRAEVVYCPVPAPAASAEERVQTRRELATPADAVVLLQASRMEPLKGHRLLLQALGRLHSEPDAQARGVEDPLLARRAPNGDANWVLWLAGGAQRPEEAAYVESLRALAVAEGIADRVRFLGQREDVPRLMAAADIYCQANVEPEGFGISFVEALYAGLPVLTTAFGGACEIVDETCGVLVPPGSVTSLAEALNTLLRDPARRARLGAAGPERARRLCDPATQVRRLGKLFRGVARQKAVGSR
jgi:glycosyltransferase involved in cell wall biosynthesis